VPLDYFQNNFSNSLPVVDKKLIGRKLWGHFGSLLGFVNVMTFPFFHDFGKWDSRRQWLNKCGLLGRCLRHSFWIPSSPKAFINFNEFTNLCISQALTFPKWVSSTDASRAWAVVSTHRSWFSWHRSWDVNWFSKKFAIALAFSFEWYVIPKGPWCL
jgi:hypothetical protein